MYKNKKIDLLRDYNYICKRIEEVNQEILKYNQLIRSTRDANKAITYDKEKVQPTNKINDITYTAVEKIVDTYAVKIAEWENKLEELFRQKDEVENILDNLNSLERKIIELKYIKKLRWYQVARLVSYSESQCRRICKNVLKKLG